MEGGEILDLLCCLYDSVQSFKKVALKPFAIFFFFYKIKPLLAPTKKKM